MLSSIKINIGEYKVIDYISCLAHEIIFLITAGLFLLRWGTYLKLDEHTLSYAMINISYVEDVTKTFK